MTQLRPAQRTITQRLADETKHGSLDLTRDPLVPAIPTPSEDPASMRKSIIAIKNLLDQREGATGSVMDMNLTMRDLLNEGALSLKVGSTRFSLPYTTSSVGIGSGSYYVDSRPSFDIPPAATALTAQGAFKNVILDWSLVDFKNFSYSEVWRSGTNALGTAVLIGTSTANLYTDANVVVGTSYYYWVRAVSTTAVAGPFNAVGGTLGGLLLIGNTDLGPLIVDATKLANGSVDFGGTKVTGTITNPAYFGAAVIGTAAIANLAVTNALIANLAVDNGKIAALSVDAAKIALATITDAQIGSLSATKITTGVLNAGLIAANAIVASQIDTRGLSIKDVAGNVILAAGNSLDFNTRFAVGTTGMPANSATVGATIGVNLGGQITAGNASTFIAAAAIGSAQVGVLVAGNLTVSALSNTINGGAGAGVDRVSISTNKIEVYDSANTLRIKIGVY